MRCGKTFIRKGFFHYGHPELYLLFHSVDVSAPTSDSFTDLQKALLASLQFPLYDSSGESVAELLNSTDLASDEQLISSHMTNPQ